MLYLAYGSNLNKSQMARRCPTAVPICRFALRGYRLVFRVVADIEHDRNGSVECGLWEITDADLVALDHYEGYPHLYDRRKVATPYGPAVVYFMLRSGSDYAAPSDGYLDSIEAGYVDFGIPPRSLENAVRFTNCKVGEFNKRVDSWMNDQDYARRAVSVKSGNANKPRREYSRHDRFPF